MIADSGRPQAARLSDSTCCAWPRISFQNNCLIMAIMGKYFKYTGSKLKLLIGACQHCSGFYLKIVVMARQVGAAQHGFLLDC